MTRYVLRLAWIPLLLLTGTLLLIHAQPDNNHDLRDLLQPQGCPTPCFMGIRPGVTTEADVVQILKTNPWIAQFEYQPGTSLIRLTWSANSPAWLINSGEYAQSFVAIRDGVVSEVRLRTALTLGDAQLIFGRSLLQSVQRIVPEGRASGALIAYSAIYPRIGVFVGVSNDCLGANQHIAYTAPIELGYAPLKTTASLPHTYTSTWADVLRASCSER